MSLVVFALGFEVYQVVAHAHCAAGRTVPSSHRSTGGFGAAIAADALCFAVSGACLYFSGATAWAVLLLPLVAHLFYGSLLAFVRPFYLRLHDYRLPSIYSDGSFCRSKRIATLIDASFHLLAVFLLARQVPAIAVACFGAAGVVAYSAVFTPAGSRIVQDQRA